MAVLLSVLPTLDSILKHFKQIHAAAKIRDVIVLQVSLCLPTVSVIDISEPGDLM
jgi:hypothetical protein